MQIDILTLFPQMFAGPFDYSIVKRAQKNSGLKIGIHDLRDWATDKYRCVDDHPYGGGPGMVLRVDVIDHAVRDLKKMNSKVILLDASGRKYNQLRAVHLSKQDRLIIVCGHYEGVDHRVHEHIANEVISIGDYVLSGGEIAAMAVVDSVVRLLPGVLGNPDSLSEESFNLNPQTYPPTPTPEYPQYTRPEDYRGWKVPAVLLSGNHHRISQWRQAKLKPPA